MTGCMLLRLWTAKFVIKAAFMVIHVLVSYLSVPAQSHNCCYHCYSSCCRTVTNVTTSLTLVGLIISGDMQQIMLGEVIMLLQHYTSHSIYEGSTEPLHTIHNTQE